MIINNITDYTLLNTPALAGVSLKHTFYEEVVNERPSIDFFEVHSENYMSKGGCSLAWLEEIRKHYPISLHGVSLSLGTDQPLDQHHLKSLKALVEKIDPWLISDHLSWSRIDGFYLNDLLPVPYTKQSLQVFIDHILEAQDYLGRVLLIENPSSYLYFSNNEYSEPEFLKELSQKTGCQLLLDVNNIYVSAHNNHFDAFDYVNEIPKESIGEIHLAGHNRDRKIYIDDHSCCVQDEVWQLYKETIKRFGKVPTLIEWDTHVPELKVLLSEAKKAKKIMNGKGPYAAAA